MALEVDGSLAGPVFWENGDSAPVLVEHLLSAAFGALIGAAIAARHAASPSA